VSLTYRIIRKLSRPIQISWQNQLLRQQLENLAELGQGVVVNGPIQIGSPNQVHFAEDVSINPRLTIRGEGGLRVGAHVHFGEDILILTSNHNYFQPDCLPYDKVRIAKDVKIEDSVWICDRVIIVPGVTVGEGSVLAAGSVITKDVPPMTVVGGSPAVALRQRDTDHYRFLKSEQRFLGWPRDFDLLNGRKVKIHRRAVQESSAL
jgi:acetyltransferase-like isoleucine patch superfamily enzyme